MVETVLESFDFLNADCSADELSLFGSIRTASVRYVSAALHYRGQGKGVKRADPRNTCQYTDTLYLAKERLCRAAIGMNIQDRNQFF